MYTENIVGTLYVFYNKVKNLYRPEAFSFSLQNKTCTLIYTERHKQALEKKLTWREKTNKTNYGVGRPPVDLESFNWDAVMKIGL